MTSRRRWMGPKHGIARGVAVFGTSASGRIETFDGILPDSGRLKNWALAHGVVLADDAAGLEDLDVHLDEWSADPTYFERVDTANEVGIYLGNVIVQNVTGAQWKVLPNGHPVISLASARELDVISMVGDRGVNSKWSLSLIYTSALST